jgi:hypothetical protein
MIPFNLQFDDRVIWKFEDPQDAGSKLQIA